MTSGKYKMLRNMFILLGIGISFVLWIFLPDTFRNTSFFHVGTGEYGSKWGVLLVLVFPLFSLCFREKQIPFHGGDEEFFKAEQEASDRVQMQCGMIMALALSLLSIALVAVAFML